MADIPAICGKCGLVFPSGMAARPGMFVIDSVAGCPRCRGGANIVNGYTTIINGLVTFIASPEHSRKEKLLLIEAAADVGLRKALPEDAARRLDAESREGGRLLREWATLGLTFVATMATVGSFLLAYSENKGNAPLDELAVEKFEELICSEHQPDRRAAWNLGHIRPVARPLHLDQGLKKGQAKSASAEAPDENRKSRRARIKKERSKSGKGQH